nr:hypothetical protein [Tanacetum cinerariifolium]
MIFYQIKTEEVSDRSVAPCFVNGLEAYDGEINLRVEENMISNEYAVKLCLKHEVKRENKVVKKELIVALRDEIYFVKFIINLEEDDVEPELGRQDMKKVDRGITMINHTQAEAMVIVRGFLRTIGGIVNTPERLFLTFDGFCHQTFYATRSDVMRNAKSDSDDEEDYQIKRNNVWKKAVSFLGSLPVPLKNVNRKPDYKGSYTKEEEVT